MTNAKNGHGWGIAGAWLGHGPYKLPMAQPPSYIFSMAPLIITTKSAASGWPNMTKHCNWVGRQKDWWIFCPQMYMLKGKFIVISTEVIVSLCSLQINIRTKLLYHYGPPKDKFSKGVQSLALLKSGEILVGAGDGTVALVRGENYKKVRYVYLDVCLVFIAFG